MKRSVKKECVNTTGPRNNILDDPKLLIMSPIVFTKKLDKMDSINTNWEPLSFKKIITMLLEESQPEYNPRNISTSTVRNMESYNELENKLRTYLNIQRSNSQPEELNLKRIIEMALNNIKTSTTNQNIQNESSQCPTQVKRERESWSSDDDDALVSLKQRKIDTPKEIDIDNRSQKKTENKIPTKSPKNVKSIAEILSETPIKNINEQSQIQRPRFKSKVRVKKKKDTTTVAEVQSQLNDYKIYAPIRNSKTVSKFGDKVLVKVKRRKELSKNVDFERQKKNQTDGPSTQDNERQKNNQTDGPDTPNLNTKIIKDAITNRIETEIQKKDQIKTPVEQNENESPVTLTNTVQNTKKKIRRQETKIKITGGMSIFFSNTGLMAKQQKVTEERYDIGKYGTLEKFFVQSQPPRDLNRYSIERTICCLYKRAQVITEILDMYEINPTAVNFLRAAHLCEVGACLCCCKPNRTQSDASSQILDKNVENCLLSSTTPPAPTPGTSLQNQNVYVTDNIMKNISAHYKLSLTLKGLITSLLTNFKGITLTTGSTGKLLAVFNTTITSWNNTDVQLMTTILNKMKTELFLSKIPAKEFCDCVNEALNKNNIYSQASSLLGSKQLLMVKEYSLAHFPDENTKVSKPEDPKIEYFRGDQKLLETSLIRGPSGVLNEVNKKNETGRKRKSIRINKRTNDEPSKKSKGNPKQGTKKDLRNKSPEALRECVFFPELIPEEPIVSENYTDTAPINKNPILQRLLTTAAPQTTLPDFGVTRIPLQYLVSVPVIENQVPLNSTSQTDNIVTIDLSSDEETILP